MGKKTVSTDGMRPKMPFQVNRALRDGIETQVTDGLRMAILSGFYKPGDMLPTILDFAHGLGVSIRAPQAALRALTREGLVSPRQRRGTMVIGPRPGVFHGRVLVVNPNDNPVYYNNVLETRLCARLTEAGYLASSIIVRPLGRHQRESSKEQFDVRRLEIALQQHTSLVLIIESHQHVERTVSQSGTPFVVIGAQKPQVPGCVGFVQFDLSGSLPAVVGRLRERGVRHLVEVVTRKGDFLDNDDIRAVCGNVEKLMLWPGNALSVTQEQFVRLALDTFATRYRTKADLPDAFLFADDYLTRGALLALLSGGIRTGRDVLVMSLSNSGITPIHPDPVDLIVRDPARHADVVADAVLGYLDTGLFPSGLVLGTEFVRGN